MTEEIHIQYRGVVCLYCAEPVALPAGPATFDVAARNADASLEAEQQSRVFVLRCSACRKEAPYRIDEVVDFPGSPKVRSKRSRPAAAAWSASRPSAKAAHG